MVSNSGDNIHKKDASGFLKSGEYNKNGQSGGIPFLVNHMQQVLVSSSSPNSWDQPLLDMFHIGRFSECDGWSRLWSTLCVIEFLTRSYPKDEETIRHPLRSVFSAKSALGDNFTEFIPKYRGWFEFLRQEYEKLRSELSEKWGMKLCCARVFEQRYRLAKAILVHFAQVCREISNNSPTVTVFYVYSHVNCLGTMLEGASLDQLKKKDNIRLFINRERLFMTWKECNHSFFEIDVEEEQSKATGAAKDEEDPADMSGANDEESRVSNMLPKSRDEKLVSNLEKAVPQIVTLKQESIISNIEQSSLESTSHDPSSCDEKWKCQGSPNFFSPKEESSPTFDHQSVHEDSSEKNSTSPTNYDSVWEASSNFSEDSSMTETISSLITQSFSVTDGSRTKETTKIVEGAKKKTKVPEEVKHNTRIPERAKKKTGLTRGAKKKKKTKLTEGANEKTKIIEGAKRKAKISEGAKEKTKILGVTEGNPTKKRKTLTTRPRLQRTRIGKINPVHFREDVDIAVPSAAIIQDKPGGFDNFKCFDADVYLVEAKRNGLMFDDRTKRLDVGSAKLPMIFIEEFRNNKNEIVKGPVTYREGKNTKVHGIGCDRYLSDNSDVILSNVTCCNTSEAYVYFFKKANIKPHFVADHSEALDYRRRLAELDVDMQVISKRKLKNPVKILSDLSLVEGLREGNREESDFIFVSSTTNLFQKFYGKDLAKIPFPTAKWMEFFDKQKTSNDNQERGFVHGHHDCGWGREGVSESTHDAQSVDIEFVLAKPRLIGNNDLMTTLGPLLDQTTMLMDAICYENGERLMNNKKRDQIFGSILREKTNSKISRFEAYTIVRQPLGLLQTSRLEILVFKKLQGMWMDPIATDFLTQQQLYLVSYVYGKARCSECLLLCIAGQVVEIMKCGTT